MAEVGETYRPGEEAPESGFYECDCPERHRYSTNVAGHTLPPMPAGRRGSQWRLAEKRPEA
jgi:hypothetical protein